MYTYNQSQFNKKGNSQHHIQVLQHNTTSALLSLLHPITTLLRGGGRGVTTGRGDQCHNIFHLIFILILNKSLETVVILYHRQFPSAYSIQVATTCFQHYSIEHCEPHD